MDRMRESMFSILGDIQGLSFLDLFAGSGIMALEALSRGAAKSFLVEKDGGKRQVLLKNLKISGEDFANGRIGLLIRPVERFLRTGMERFDVVHLDPPFAMKNKVKLLRWRKRPVSQLVGGLSLYIIRQRMDCPVN